MRQVLSIIQQVLSTPAIFVGLIALVGLLLQKADHQTVIKGTIKTILGFVILNAGGSIVQQAIIPFGNLFQAAFHVQGVVPNNEAIVSIGMQDFGMETASIFALGMVLNIVLARFSKLKYIYLSGHCSLYMACMLAIILHVGGLSGWKLILAGSLLIGLYMAVSPALIQKTVTQVIGDDSLAIAHTGSFGYWLSAMCGKLFGKKENTKTTEDVNFPQGLAFLRDNTISIAIVMFFCYFVVSLVAVFSDPADMKDIIGDTNWVIYCVIQSITFSGGIYIILAGVRMLIGEIVPAFKGISEKLVPSAKPALDCPVLFTFAPNAVLIGFLCSFIGGIVGLAVLAGLNVAGFTAAIILPGAVVHFFCGASAGVCGNATGGLKGCVLGSFVHGLLVTFLAAGLMPVLGSLGFASTTFSDSDYAVVGIPLGNLARVMSGNGLLILSIVLFCIPIIVGMVKRGKPEQA